MSSLFRKEGDPITAGDWNALVALNARTRPLPGKVMRRGRPFAHPWKVTAERAEEPTARRWIVRTAAGTINDNVPTIPYLRINDERGWQMPDGYPDPEPSRPFIERLLLDLDDPPYHLLTAPSASGELADFIAITDSARPEFFRTAEMWEQRLWRASVVLSATPYQASADRYFPRLLPTTLRRFRIFAGGLPSRNTGVKAGDYLELARLFLARPLTAPDTTTDVIYVQQRVFWPLGVAAIEPTLDLGQGLEDVPGDFSQMLADLLQSQLESDLSEAAFVNFWTT
jgi:hypothetical protein